MHLDRLTVRQFRNISSAELDLLPGINVLWGPNAQGKTNLLEAVHFLVTGRSFRTARERQCLPADMEESQSPDDDRQEENVENDDAADQTSEKQRAPYFLFVDGEALVPGAEAAGAFGTKTNTHSLYLLRSAKLSYPSNSGR